MQCFDDFRLDPGMLRLSRGALDLDAPPQAVEVLAYLISNAHRTVTRDELLDRFWPRAGTGGDAALNTCIRRIRALLDDDADAPRYIQTRPRAGYRFVGQLKPEPAAPSRRRWRRLAVAVGMTASVTLAGAVWGQQRLFPPHRTIVIEPVQGLCEYVLFPRFNSGLRESFVSTLSQDLPARFSIVASGKRADLHARVSVRQTPQHTLVALTLIEDGNGRILWSEEFDAPTDRNDYVPLQRALANRMAVSLNRALVDRL
ncbi:hypothetical protein DMC47_26295 [Nostoc sp. 3335mG]|nr:hypothetical protein DMC47_26295 [Nostoc sp. 3335mG]